MVDFYVVLIFKGLVRGHLKKEEKGKRGSQAGTLLCFLYDSRSCGFRFGKRCSSLVLLSEPVASTREVSITYIKLRTRRRGGSPLTGRLVEEESAERQFTKVGTDKGLSVEDAGRELEDRYLRRWRGTDERQVGGVQGRMTRSTP